MEKYTITNIPLNKVFKFSENRYVWKTTRNSTRKGNYDGKEYISTEIFTKDKLGKISCIWDGQLVTNPSLYKKDGLDNNNCFRIFSYDMDCGANFEQKIELVEAPIEIQKEILALENASAKKR